MMNLIWMITLGLTPSAPARAVETVSLVLLLATDVSNSIDDSEYQIQHDGILAALTDPEVASAVTRCAPGGVALAYAEWASFNAYTLAIPFRRVGTASDLKAFAAHLRNVERSSLNIMGTDVGNALERSRDAIVNAPFTARRRVIDVSGDGTQNIKPPGSGNEVNYISRLEASRDAVVADGVQINALVIQRYDERADVADLRVYFDEHVIGGPDAFAVSVDSIEDMHQRFKEKLKMEICAGPPT